MRPLPLLVPVLAVISLLAGCAAPGSQLPAGGAESLRVADAALANGAPQIALQAIDGILKADPDNVPALMRQGAAQMAMGNLPAATASYRRVITLSPRDSEARMDLGRAEMRLHPEVAEQIFAQLAAEQPRNAQVLNNLGVARDLQGRHAEAQAAYGQALAVQPGLVSAQQNRALSLAVSGHAQEAAGILNRMAMSGEGGRKVRDNLALALAASGNTAGAGSLLRETMSPADVTRAVAAYRDLGTGQP